jgi:hypothetical protein
MNRSFYLILPMLTLYTVACHRAVQTPPDPLSMGIYKKVQLVIESANQLSNKARRKQPTQMTLDQWKVLFSESGYMVVIPRQGEVLKLSLDDFAERCHSQKHHYVFDRTTVNHYSNFEPGVDNKLFADNQVYHDVKEFSFKGDPIATRESFVKQPLAQKLANDFWQIYTLTVRER